MSSFSVVICLTMAVFLSAAQAGRVEGYGAAPSYDYDDGHHAPAHYQFKYGVHDTHTGDVKEQWEQREGDVVKGSYSLVEPDGTLRVVEYTSDGKNGFNAVVKRTGHGAHPTGHGHEQAVAAVY